MPSSARFRAPCLARSVTVAALLVAAGGCAETASQPSAEAAPAPAEIVAAYGEQAPTAAPSDPQIESYQRDQLVAVLASLPAVERVAWSSGSTLVVAVADLGAARATLCPIVERYPTLRATRLQLQPPADSGQAVRFMQCKAY